MTSKLPVCLHLIFLPFTLLNLIIEIKINLLIFEGSLSLACNGRNAFFTSEQLKNIMHGIVKMFVIR